MSVIQTFPSNLQWRRTVDKTDSQAIKRFISNGIPLVSVSFKNYNSNLVVKGGLLPFLTIMYFL